MIAPSGSLPIFIIPRTYATAASTLPTEQSTRPLVIQAKSGFRARIEWRREENSAAREGNRREEGTGVNSRV